MIYLLGLISFLIGSIPVGLIVARVKGIDLRKVGSGNIGATNVLRAMGKGPALITLAGDMLKGFLPVIISSSFLNDTLSIGIIGLVAILGHDFSLFLRFRGGKGVATSIGVLLAYSPFVAILTILLWIIIVFMSRYSSMGAIVSFILLPLNIYVFDYSYEKFVISIFITILLLFKHRENIGRLLTGQEPKIGERIRE
ncbi:MAG: glycerol-3-phosphate 1-O-acyltransferase PlsY [Thermodesulfovibrionales bacterium]